jgi:hypothetical protein
VSTIVGKFLIPPDEQVTVVRDLYATGNLCLRVVDAEGAPYATLSVNFPPEILRDAGFDLGDPDLFYMKDWSENENVARWARVSGLFERADVAPIGSGFITAHAYRVVQR